MGHVSVRKFLPALLVFGLLLASLAPPALLLAQTNLGSIVGVVADASGASVKHASVRVTKCDIGVIKPLSADHDGAFNCVSMVPGNYVLQVDSPGFHTYSHEAIDPQIAGTVRVDPEMSVGSASETVDVSADTRLLQTDISSLGGVIEGPAIMQTPINERYVNNLLLLLPGVVAGGSTSGNPIGNQTKGAVTNAIVYGNYQIGGGFGGQSEFFVNRVQRNVPEHNNNALTLPRTWCRSSASRLTM